MFKFKKLHLFFLIELNSFAFTFLHLLPDKYTYVILCCFNVMCLFLKAFKDTCLNLRREKKGSDETKDQKRFKNKYLTETRRQQKEYKRQDSTGVKKQEEEKQET